MAHKHENREAWLNYLAGRMRPWFEELGSPLPKQVRIAIGFTSVGMRARGASVNAGTTDAVPTAILRFS
jgi:hypothetical protein